MSALASIMTTSVAFSGGVVADRNGGHNFNPSRFEEVYDFITEYKKAENDERKKMEEDLTEEEYKAVKAFNVPVETVVYEINASGPRKELESLDTVETLESGRISTSSVNVQSSQRRDSVEPAVIRKWNKDTVEKIIREDEQESLALHHKLKEGAHEPNSQTPTQAIRTTGVVDSGSDTYSHIIEENSPMGATTYRWEHKIHWDWRISDGGGRVFNTRNQHGPKHTTYFMSYQGKTDEWEAIETNGKSSPEDDVYQEAYHSYIMGHMEQGAPSIGVSAYEGHPYSELRGADGPQSWCVDSGIET
ncbi:hypothetical protein [Natrinema sp. H-ect4]|uniref:hypothetical protein n=1 Tax=Natrinema sp. H-ect4 TaxID=3242699 RepID=UPI0035A8ED51